MFVRRSFPMEGEDKGGSTPTPATPAAPAAATPTPTGPAPAALPPDVAAKELAEARKEAAAYRERLRKHEQEAEERQKSALAEQGKFKELYEAEKKKADDLATRVTSYEETFKATVDAELSTVPEQFRTLIPAGTDAQKLAWVKQAKAAGLFQPAPSAPPKPPATAPTAPPPPVSGTPRTFTNREIDAMSFEERSKLMPELMAAAREGRIVD